MTIVIKKSSTNREKLEKVRGSIKRKGKFHAFKYCGIINVKESPLQIQQKMRDEWE